jgi:ABC-2 type transport system ATP-binding protein
MTTIPFQPAIAATGLRKSFGDTLALDGIDLEVAEGTIFALLGPNGAGKTTAVQILSSLISPDGGEVRVAGHDLAREPDAVRSAIGVTGQFSAVDNLLTGEENLLLMADLYHLDRRDGRRRTADLLERFELVEAAKKTPATYSGGMLRRLDLAMTLVGDPSIIFLDEPTAGLDPRSRRTTWEIVRGLVAGGATIFLTTQYLEEADELADRIALLDQGKLVAEGTADQLKRRIPGGHIRLQFTDADGLDAAARILGEVVRDHEALTLQVPSDGSVESLRALLDRLDGTTQRCPPYTPAAVTGWTSPSAVPGRGPGVPAGTSGVAGQPVRPSLYLQLAGRDVGGDLEPLFAATRDRADLLVDRPHADGPLGDLLDRSPRPTSYQARLTSGRWRSRSARRGCCTAAAPAPAGRPRACAGPGDRCAASPA